MKDFLQFIEQYQLNNIHSSQINKAMEHLNPLFNKISEIDDKLYNNAIKEFHECICGKHFNEYFAKYEVDKMFHTNNNGEKIVGEILNYNCAKRIYDTKIKYINSSINIWYVYVALNAQYHYYHCYYKELFPQDSDEMIKDKIINSAIVFWFKDEDGEDNKIWDYFK